MLVDGYERVACYARYVIAYYLYLVVSGRIGPFQTFSIRFRGFMVYILYSSASSAVSAMSVCSVARPMDIRGLSMSLSACISSKTRLMTSSVSARLCLLKVQVMLR